MSKGKLFFLALFCCVATNAFAVEEPYLNELKGNDVAVGKFFTVSDEKFNSLSSGQWSAINHISVDNIISLEINFDTSVYFYNQPFNCTVGFKIYIYGNQSDTSEITDSVTHANINLNVVYDTVTGRPYKGIALYKFKNAHKYKVKILSVSCPQLSPILPIFRLKGQIIINRKYEFQDVSTDITRYSRLNGNQLKLEWSPSNYPGAEMFDLEFTHIDYSSQVASTILAASQSSGLYELNADSLAKWFKNNATRVTTASSSYLLNLAYDSGFILFRIRGVQLHYPDDVRWEGDWNYAAKHKDTACSGSCPTGALFVAGHEQNLNWQFAISFAEEGKKKEVISYFDGSLRNRQSVTINNSDNKSVVAETIYDALGRPAASILPAPTDDKTIHYFRGFNKNSSNIPYSFSDLFYANCFTVAAPLSDTSGTGRYYSPRNDFYQNDSSNFYYAKYIPDAAGYPFAVSEYMADNTGRIKAQGGVGRIFQLDSTHKTTYFYGKPTQVELDRLFGSEAGDASHYLKNMVADANGQISVSYVDASGKTIATALAGATPVNFHSLPSNGEGTSVQVNNDIIKAGDFLRNPTDNTLTATATFLAPVTGDYSFKYRVDPLVYQKLYGPNKDSVICSDCHYDLEITVKDDCNNMIDSVLVPAATDFDTTCSNLPDTIQGTLDVTLHKIGEYYITYRLRVSEDALNFYDSVHLAKNSDIRHLNSFLLDELKNTDFSGCYSNCETCMDKLGTSQEFVANFKQLYLKDSISFSAPDSAWAFALYDSLLQHCINIQVNCHKNVCDEKLDLLKMDVSPGGQYALYDSSYTLLETSINVIARRSEIAFFTNESGARDSVLVFNGEGEDSLLVDVKELNDSMFVRYWNDTWADSLVKLHPEYCHYLWCITNDVSYTFDKEISDWLDSDTAIARGWFNPSDYKALLDHDPFFESGGAGHGLYNKMKKSLQYFSRKYTGYSLADKNILEFIDISLYCRNQANGWTDCHPDNGCRSRNREWSLYKALYLNLKLKYYEEARRTSSNPVFENCTNCYIGPDILAETGIVCEAPPITDFTLTDFSGFKKFINYKDSISGLKNPVAIDIEYKNLCYLLDCPGGYTLDTMTRIMSKGDWVNSFFYPSERTDYRIIAVRCLSEDWQPFSDSSNCDYSCPEGVYNPYDRDSISFYVEHGVPGTAPSGTPANYGNCQFYSVFDLQTGLNTSCRFFNVWVCVYDSTCGGVCAPDSTSDYPSSCPDNPNAELYKNKQRRYPEYVNSDEYMKQLLATNPQQQSNENTEAIAEQYAQNCEAQADYWMNVLRRCNPDVDTMNTLRLALIDICKKGASFSAPFGTSSLPSGVAATYHSFEEAITALIPGAANDSCTAELLAMPYPFDRQPVYVDRIIIETDYDICQKLTQQRLAYISSGFAGSFHGYMRSIYGQAYTLDSLELDDLQNACTNCNGILKNDMVLPVMLDPQSRPCAKCDSISAGFTGFKAKFPVIDSTSDDYEILFTNYFNHRFGFALTYDQYRTFLDSCIINSSYEAEFCNKPVTEETEGDPNACMKELYLTAMINANNAYVAYIDSVRKDFREAWLTKCMNVQPVLKMTADLYEYHYTLYYYDQNGNLVKTVPPEGVQFMSDADIATLQAKRKNTQPDCNTNNGMHFGWSNVGGGYIEYTNASTYSQLRTGTQPFSLEFSINLESYLDQGIAYSGNVAAYNSEAGFGVFIKDDKLNFLICEGPTANRVQAETTSDISSFIPLYSWAHVVVERVGNGADGSMRIYINGALIPITYTANNLTTGDVSLAVGSQFYLGAAYKNGGWTGSGLRGSLRHFRIYQRAIPQVEARQNAMDYCGNPSNMQSMVFWEPFTSGSSVAMSGHDYVVDRIYGAMGWLSGSQYYLTDALSTLVPAHRLVTTYHYNSLNQVLQQYSPDGDTSRFYYDRLGRLFASQNMKQLREDSYDAGEGRYSYTRYDSLGRIAEVGEKSGDVGDIAEVNLLDREEVNDWLASGTDKQVTKTLYDNPVNINEQDYGTSRKRVVASIYLDAAGDSEGDSSLYVYDIIGNVRTLLQHNKRLVAVDNANGRKRIDYDYDLVSGKVNMVSYQHGKGDQFYYKYSYDAENRLTRSLNSRDKLIWTEDASYSYYLHGPLAKTELGQLKVQGVDYMYTLQGWLKGINGNALSPQYEMGQDGYSGTTFGRVSRDVYSYGLGYFADDYKPIGTGAHAMNQAAYVHPDNTANTGRQLFNGNISNTVVALSKIESGAAKGYSYGYDQLNRLVYMNQHTVSGSTWSNSNIISAYAEGIAYDANGNILKYLRNGANVSGMPLQMDSLSYKYNRDISGHLVNNKLRQVKDAVSASNYSVDIDDQSDADNYSYDRIGNLKKDIAEGIDTIRWTVYGKINKVVKAGASTVIDYSYDPGGNRTTKNVTVSGNTTTTFYVRDAQGNVMGVYEKKNTDDLTWEEQHLYGSSRLGMWRNDTIVPASAPVVQGTTPLYDSLLFGSRTYELSNHLGNVLATISDKKIGNDSSGIVNYYIAEVLSQSDYYPFGMLQPGRRYDAIGSYRFGFNGKENDNKDGVVQYDYGFRIYDPRLVRFKSVDPLTNKYPELTPYQFASNTPIQAIDLDGLEAWKVTNQWTPELIKQYQNVSPSVMQNLNSANKRYTCEDFAITTLATFAKNNGLPFKWETGAKSFDAEDLNYKDFNTFLKDVKMKTGAADFKNDKNTSRVSANNINFGTNVLHSSAGEKDPHHVSVVSGITYNEKNQVTDFSYYQGNFRGGIFYDRLLGSSDPDSWNYHGAFIQQGAYSLTSDTWMNFTLDRITISYTSDQQLEYRNFNFMNMNVKYKYKLVEKITTTSSPTTMVPVTTITTEYDRGGIEQRKPENE